MQVTEVRVYPNDHDELRGHASVTLDNCLMVRDLKILLNDSGALYVAMPNRKQRDGIYREIAYPVSAKARRMIEEAVLRAYRAILRAAKNIGRKALIEYKGYLIFGAATKPHPGSPDWRAGGIACRKTAESLIVQIEPVGGFLFTTKGAAERHGLELCQEWADEQIRSNQVQEENRENLLH